MESNDLYISLLLVEYSLKYKPTVYFHSICHYLFLLSINQSISTPAVPNPNHCLSCSSPTLAQGAAYLPDLQMGPGAQDQAAAINLALVVINQSCYAHTRHPLRQATSRSNTSFSPPPSIDFLLVLPWLAERPPILGLLHGSCQCRILNFKNGSSVVSLTISMSNLN